MKKLIALIVLLMLALPVAAQTTTSLGLVEPAVGSVGWGDEMNDNLSLINMNLVEAESEVAAGTGYELAAYGASSGADVAPLSGIFADSSGQNLNITGGLAVNSIYVIGIGANLESIYANTTIYGTTIGYGDGTFYGDGVFYGDGTFYGTGMFYGSGTFDGDVTAVGNFIGDGIVINNNGGITLGGYPAGSPIGTGVGAGVTILGAPVGSVVTADGAGWLVLPRTSPNETPAGTLDGTNAVFTLANPPANNSLMLYRNGLLQALTAQYTLASNSITFVTGFVPQPGDVLTATYQY